MKRGLTPFRKHSASVEHCEDDVIDVRHLDFKGNILSIHPVDPVILSRDFSSSRGFTLLEIMVSMVLIATALLAIVRLQAQNLELQSESQFMTVARLLAQERLAWIAGNPGNFNEGRSDGDFGEYHPDFRYTQEISRTDSGGDLYRVSLQIFIDETAPERAFSVETFMYRGAHDDKL